MPQKPSEKPTEFLTYLEFAKELRVCRSTVKNWVRQGKLRHIEFGRLRRIPREEFARLKALAK